MLAWNLRDYENEGIEPKTIKSNLIVNMETCQVYWSGDGVSLKSYHMDWVLTQRGTVKPSVLTIDEWKLFHLSTLRCSRTRSLSSINCVTVDTRKIVFLRPYFPVTTVFLSCLLTGQWGNIYMLIICHPSISSRAVLVSPQERHGSRDKRHPSLFVVHQIVCSVAKEVNCNFVIGCQELMA